MDMEGSRRSFDRSRELGVKKPRLVEETDRDRNPNGCGFLQRPTAPATGSVVVPSRLRATERDVSSRGGAYQPQHPHHELVSRYKTALGELTFNSKPIINNLTIIAGENLHAGKAIAATVCLNILEVPSEQKLPSLYLLDSIVKNIGRDYIKYFASRLPEVFCKAYRQVDSSIHSGMRHLFGTWKGVFPLQPLQLIEKELGFSPAVNGSSSVASTSRPDTQSQQTPHGIHINPKYLEARQRLQQSNRAKGMTDELAETVSAATDDVERVDRTAGISASITWANLPVKMTNIHRSQSGSEPVHDKKKIGAYENYKYGPDLSRDSGLGIGKASERAPELSRYVAGSSVSEASSSQRIGFDIKHKFSGYSVPTSVNADVHLQATQSIANRGSGLLSRNWKNSEEEEYMWDDMNPKFKDRGAASSLGKDHWALDDTRSENHLQKPQKMNDIGSKLDVDASIESLSTEWKDRAPFGPRVTSAWSMPESHSVDGLSPSDSCTIISGPLEGNPTSLSELSTSGSSLAMRDPRQLIGLSHSKGSDFGFVPSASTGTIGQQWPNSWGNASPSGQSGMHQNPSSTSYSGCHPQLYHSSAERDHYQGQSSPLSDFKAALIPGQLNSGLHNRVTEGSVTVAPQNIQPGHFQKIQSQNLQTSSPSLLPFQLRPQIPYSQQMHAQPEPPPMNPKPLLPQVSKFRSQPTVENSSPDHSNSQSADFPGQSNPSSLLAAVMKSGILSNNSATSSQPKLGFHLDTRTTSQSAVQPPSTNLTSSGPKVASTPLLVPHSLDKAPYSTNPSQRKEERSPLPPSLPPPSSTEGSASAPISNSGSNTANPISNLLSTLVAKGLISASKTESPSVAPPPKSMKSQNQSSSVTTTSSVPVSSALVCSAPLASSVKSEVSLLKPEAKSSVALPESLIGFEFKADVIRESHPSVVNGLFDGLLHQCSICGLRLRHKDRLDRHLEWHASKMPKPGCLCRASRKWYTHPGYWVTGELCSGFISTDLVDGSVKAKEKNEQMVLADESQCICVLCGELFEDFYSQERDGWMFKDAVYMTVPTGYDELRATKDTTGQGPIVHVNCLPESSLHDLGLTNDIKMEVNG